MASEMRNELAGSFIGLAGLTAVTLYVYFAFRGIADPIGLHVWAIAMAAILAQWLVGLVVMWRRRPGDAEMLRFWIPAGRRTMTLSNVATAASVWLLLPVAPDPLREVMIVLYLSYVVVQFAIATEGTQVAASAVAMVLGSVVAVVAASGTPSSLPLALFLAMIGGMLLAVRRLIRRNVVAATEARLASELAAERLREALAAVAAERDARTRFIRSASHDLSQPLQAARLFFEEHARATDAPARERAGAGVRRALAATAALLDEMLMHLRLEAGAVRSVPETVDLRGFLRDVAFDHGPAASEAGMGLRVARGGAFAVADPHLLKRAVGNLVANAVRHSRGENVLIAARRNGDRVRVWVLDDGEGVDAALEARLFEDFAQGVRSERAGGFGLGLASARKLAEAMGGSAGHEPRWRSGGAFYVELPAADLASAALRAAA